MPSRRVARLNEQLKREISAILRRRVRDPRASGVTVTGVEAAPDLTYARVWVRIVGSDAERSEAFRGLGAAAPFIRGELSRTLRTRRVPELDFREDVTMERASRIEEILRDIDIPDEESNEDGSGEEEAPDPSS